MNEKNNTDSSQNNPEISAQLSKSEIFGILQNDRRRCFLELLYCNENHSLKSISEEIARLESKGNDPEISIKKSIYVSLLQTHIPKLESMGIIKYDRDEDKIELLPRAQDLCAYLGTYLEANLNTVKRKHFGWSRHYMALGVLAMVGNAAILVGFVNFISYTHWMFFICVILFISAVVQILKM